MTDENKVVDAKVRGGILAILHSKLAVFGGSLAVIAGILASVGEIRSSVASGVSIMSEGVGLGKKTSPVIADFVKFTNECGAFRGVRDGENLDRRSVFVCSDTQCLVGIMDKYTDANRKVTVYHSYNQFEIADVARAGTRLSKTGEAMPKSLVLQCKTGECFNFSDEPSSSEMVYTFASAECADRFRKNIIGADSPNINIQLNDP